VTRAEEFEELRPLLFSIAYRILGSVSEAEDAVQEAFSMAVSRSSIRTSSACITFLLIPLPLDALPVRHQPRRWAGEDFQVNGPETFPSSPASPAAIQGNTPENRQPPTTRMAKQRPRLSHSHRQKRKLRCNPRCARLGVCRRVRLRPGLGLGEAAGEWRGPTSRACLTGCTPEGASVTRRRGLTLVRASSGATTGGAARMGAVQHGSTATHPDAGGLAGTREDGDLHGWTRVDVLPPDGMQEVSGSSPLSSTGQKRNSN
jgi:Sigma-70 region 2